MDIDFNRFRNHDIPQLLCQAGQMCTDLGLSQVSPSIMLIILQQQYSEELLHYFNLTRIDIDLFYPRVAGLLNNTDTASDENEIQISDSLYQAFALALQIENSVRQMAYPNSALVTALLMVPGPLHDLAFEMGITSSMMQKVISTEERKVILTYNDEGNTIAGFSDEQKYVSGAIVVDNIQNHCDIYGAFTDEESLDDRRNPEILHELNENRQMRSETSTDANNCPTLKRFCSNWLKKARIGEIEPAIGRDKEIKRMFQILSRRTKNNPILVGEPGTGKTAIVEGFAHKLLYGEVPEDLAALKLYQLDLGVINGVDNNEEVMRSIIDELKHDKDIVLFIDEIHTLIGTCNCADNAIANILKPEMARGTIKILGATTSDEYTKHIEKDKAFERRFQKIMVEEPDVNSTILIVKGIKNRFELHHHVTISDPVVECAVKLSHRYITDRKLPDKAIDLVDEAASCVRMERQTTIVTEKDIMDVVTRWTGIPMQSMTEDDTERLRHIEEYLHESVIGQDKAISVIANAIRRSRIGLNDPLKPIGSFLFLGTTGVGKTELCKALAEYLFHSRDMIVRIDMSEYQQEHSAARLFGAPPGYVGYEQGGQLTEAVRRKPYSLVLFDEIEKANPKILETLLQVLDDGRMTDGQGHIVNFKNTIIVMTSNMGQSEILRTLAGRIPDAALIERASDAVLTQLKTRVAPEFVNRIDNIVMFLPLTREDIHKIAELQLKTSIKKMQINGIQLTYTPDVLDFIVEHGYQPEYGGRPVKRVINESIHNAISTSLINGNIKKDLPIRCFVSEGSIAFKNINNN